MNLLSFSWETTKAPRLKQLKHCCGFLSLPVLQVREAESGHNMCDQTERSYRWETFVLGMEQPSTCKEKHGRITGTIWSPILPLLSFFFFFCLVCWGISLRLSGACLTLNALQTLYTTENTPPTPRKNYRT